MSIYSESVVNIQARGMFYMSRVWNAIDFHAL